jgi:hypothetical protein
MASNASRRYSSAIVKDPEPYSMETKILGARGLAEAYNMHVPWFHCNSYITKQDNASVIVRNVEALVSIYLYSPYLG